MRLSEFVLAGVIAVGLLTGSASGADGDLASLRQEVVRRLDAFRKLTSRAEEAGLDVSREQVTITTAEIFLTYADWDATHPDELQAAIASWWRVRKQAKEISDQLPQRELRELLDVLDVAGRELTELIERPSSRRAVPRTDSSSLLLVDGYFHCDGRPTFPSSFVWMPEEEKLHDAYGKIGGTYLAPSNLQPDGAGAKIRYQPLGSDEPMGYVFLGHSGMPQWVRRKHMDIETGKRHFTGYDIDHPATREVWHDLLAAAVPQFAGRKVCQGGYLLANEPHWFSATGEWDTGPVSDYTQTKFRTWLEGQHRTIDVLNELWGTRFATFADVSIEVPVDAALRGTPIWYDWCRFNMHRVTDWFLFLKAEIRRHDPEAKTHIKLIPSHFSQGARSHGLDFEALVQLQEVIGCDAKIVNEPWHVQQDDWTDRYACDWRNLAMSYDFFRSVSPDKLLFDSEFHGLSTVHWRDPNLSPDYVRCIYWLAHMHGMGMNQTWYWSRDADGAPKRQSESGFYASNLTMPRVMDAFGRTMKELNAFAPEMVALATQPKPIRLFYSETAAIQEAGYMDRMHESYRSLYHHGFPLGFVTERMLHEASERQLKEWPVIVVPHANHVTKGEHEALSRYDAKHGTLVLIGKDCLSKDEYGRPRTKPLSLAGQSVRAAQLSDPSVTTVVAAVLQGRDLVPPIRLHEVNPVGQAGCVWRTSPWEGGNLLLVINLGKTDAQLVVTGESGPCRDVITNNPHPDHFTLPPFGVKLLHVGTSRRD